jgi:geranylgeranyl reductase family protein
MERNHIETIIVGAGPAGSTCGYILAKNNRDCLIIDRKEFPRDKLCGGGLTPKAHILINQIFGDIQYDYFPVKKIDLYSGKKYACSFSLDIEIRNVKRKDFDHILLKEYEKSGGDIITDTVVNIEEAGNKKYILLKSGRKLSCDYLIGADGANSIVRRHLQPGFKRGYVWLEKYVHDKSMMDMRVFFDSKFKNGYLYLFPNNGGYIAGYGGKNTKLKVFENALSDIGLSNNNKTKGAYIPMYDKLSYPFRNDIILAGDAGGYADSMTGEGIYFAIKSGENAAVSIINKADFRLQNKGVTETIKKRKRMADLFYLTPVNKLFIYMCKKPALLTRINKRVNLALSD